MNRNELKDTFLSGEPVICGSIEYSCISGLILRKVKGSGKRTLVQAELSDKNGNSVTIARAAQIKKVESK